MRKYHYTFTAPHERWPADNQGAQNNNGPAAQTSFSPCRRKGAAQLRNGPLGFVRGLKLEPTH